MTNDRNIKLGIQVDGAKEATETLKHVAANTRNIGNAARSAADDAARAGVKIRTAFENAGEAAHKKFATAAPAKELKAAAQQISQNLKFAADAYKASASASGGAIASLVSRLSTVAPQVAAVTTAVSLAISAWKKYTAAINETRDAISNIKADDTSYFAIKNRTKTREAQIEVRAESNIQQDQTKAKIEAKQNSGGPILFGIAKTANAQFSFPNEDLERERAKAQLREESLKRNGLFYAQSVDEYQKLQESIHSPLLNSAQKIAGDKIDKAVVEKEIKQRVQLFALEKFARENGEYSLTPDQHRAKLQLRGKFNPADALSPADINKKIEAYKPKHEAFIEEQAQARRDADERQFQGAWKSMTEAERETFAAQRERVKFIDGHWQTNIPEAADPKIKLPPTHIPPTVEKRGNDPAKNGFIHTEPAQIDKEIEQARRARQQAQMDAMLTSGEWDETESEAQADIIARNLAQAAKEAEAQELVRIRRMEKNGIYAAIGGTAVTGLVNPDTEFARSTAEHTAALVEHAAAMRDILDARLMSNVYA